MLLGCVQREFYPGVNAATARVLAAEGCDVVVPPDQGCCGALSVHAGREAEGLDYARALIDAFARRGRGADRGQLRRVRVHDEGLRGPARGRPRVRRAGRRVRGEDPRRRRGAGGAGARRAAAPAAGDRRLPRRLPPAARPGRQGAAARGARDDPRAGGQGDRRGRHVLRVGRHLQPAPTRSRRGELGRPQGRERGGDRRRAAGHRPTRAACCRSRTRCGGRGGSMPTAHMVLVLDASLRGVGPEELLG